MIREEDLDEAIASCQGERNPTSSTCIKLAAFYMLKQFLFQKEQPFSEMPQYSFSSGDESGSIHTDLDSDFCKAIDGRKQDEIIPILDDLMQTLSVIYPKLYTLTMSKL